MFSKSSHRLLYVLKVTKYRERMENVNEKVYEMCVCMDMRVCVCMGVDCFLKLRRYFI